MKEKKWALVRLLGTGSVDRYAAGLKVCLTRRAYGRKDSFILLQSDKSGQNIYLVREIGNITCGMS